MQSSNQEIWWARENAVLSYSEAVGKYDLGGAQAGGAEPVQQGKQERADYLSFIKGQKEIQLPRTGAGMATEYLKKRASQFLQGSERTVKSVYCI